MTGGHTAWVRLLTMAPERAGAEAFIREAVSRGITVSIGHTAATAEQTHQAADGAPPHVTHTFNAQPPLHHREPGVPGAALTDERLYTEIICDGIHLHPDVIRLTVACQGRRTRGDDYRCHGGRDSEDSALPWAVSRCSSGRGLRGWPAVCWQDRC